MTAKWTPKQPDHPPPPHHPRQPGQPPPGWRPSLGAGAGAPRVDTPTNPPNNNPLVSPPPRIKPVAQPRQPPVPPPPRPAPQPNIDPSALTVSVKSLRLGQKRVQQDPTTPGVSLSPDPPCISGAIYCRGCCHWRTR